MKKITGTVIAVCMLLSGCGAGMPAGASAGYGEHYISEDMETGMKECENIENGMADLERASEDLGIKEVEDNWPESIRYHADGVSADPLLVTFKVDEPMTLSVSCVTTGGDLRLKITDNVMIGGRVYFDEADPDGSYTVDIDEKGTYHALFYAKRHAGSVEITPE